MSITEQRKHNIQPPNVSNNSLQNVVCFWRIARLGLDLGLEFDFLENPKKCSLTKLET